MFKSCPSGSQSFVQFGFDIFAEIDNTISENSNIIGVGSICFLCGGFFIEAKQYIFSGRCAGFLEIYLQLLLVVLIACI